MEDTDRAGSGMASVCFTGASSEGAEGKGGAVEPSEELSAGTVGKVVEEPSEMPGGSKVSVAVLCAPSEGAGSGGAAVELLSASPLELGAVTALLDGSLAEGASLGPSLPAGPGRLVAKGFGRRLKIGLLSTAGKPAPPGTEEAAVELLDKSRPKARSLPSTRNAATWVSVAIGERLVQGLQSHCPYNQ